MAIDVKALEKARLLDLPEPARKRPPILIHDLTVYTYETCHTSRTQRKHPNEGHGPAHEDCILGGAAACEACSPKNVHYIAIAYVGKSAKATHRYRYSTSAQRDTAIMKWIRDRKEAAKYKEERKAQRSDTTDMDVPRVGDIFYASWGYEQTNIDFYEVVAVKPKSIDVRHLGKSVARRGQYEDYVVPDRTRSEGISKNIRFHRRGPNDRRASFTVEKRYATLWDGKPIGQTAAGYGHSSGRKKKR